MNEKVRQIKARMEQAKVENVRYNQVRKIFSAYVKKEGNKEIIEQLPSMLWNHANEICQEYAGRKFVSDLPEGFNIRITIEAEKFFNLYQDALSIDDEKSILEKMLEIDMDKGLGHEWFIVKVMDEKGYLKEHFT